MSIRYPVKNISPQCGKSITKDLSFKQLKKNNYNQQQQSLEAWWVSENEDYIHLPFHYAVNTIPNASDYIPKRSDLPAMSKNIKFTQKLRPLQEEVKPEVFKILQKQGTCLISLYPGAGKTAFSIMVATRLKLKTLIVVPGISLVEQWRHNLMKFTTVNESQIVILHPKSKDHDFVHHDFVIVNAENLRKFTPEVLSHFGLLILDEVHVLMTKGRVPGICRVCPRYSIALSATPYRYEGWDRAIDPFFGCEKRHVFRKLWREHKVFKIMTGFKFPIKKNANGEKDWNHILECQATHEERNTLITRLVTHYSDRGILILCKRVDHVNLLFEQLSSLGVSVTRVNAGDKNIDSDARVIVATIGKMGLGVDQPQLNMFILAGDAENYYFQYMCRVFRREDGIPLIFDIVDDDRSLKNHSRSRNKTYKSHGGEVIVVKDIEDIFSQQK